MTNITKTDLDWLRETFDHLSFAVDHEFNCSKEQDEASEAERARATKLFDLIEEGVRG